MSIRSDIALPIVAPISSGIVGPDNGLDSDVNRILDAGWSGSVQDKQDLTFLKYEIERDVFSGSIPAGFSLLVTKGDADSDASFWLIKGGASGDTVTIDPTISYDASLGQITTLNASTGFLKSGFTLDDFDPTDCAIGFWCNGITLLTGSRGFMGAFNATPGDYLQIGKNSGTSTWYWRISSGGSVLLQASEATVGSEANIRSSIVSSVSATDVRAYINGSQITQNLATDRSGTFTATNELNLGRSGATQNCDIPSRAWMVSKVGLTPTQVSALDSIVRKYTGLTS